MDIRDSSTCWAIFDARRIQEAQKLILGQGQRKFDSPSDAITAAIMAISALERFRGCSSEPPGLSRRLRRRG